MKRPRPNRDKEIVELKALEPLLVALESAQPTHEMELSEEQGRAIKSFQLLTRKPRMIIVNTNDDELPSEEPVLGHSLPVWRHPACFVECLILHHLGYHFRLFLFRGGNPRSDQVFFDLRKNGGSDHGLTTTKLGHDFSLRINDVNLVGFRIHGLGAVNDD